MTQIWKGTTSRLWQEQAGLSPRCQIWPAVWRAQSPTNLNSAKQVRERTENIGGRLESALGYWISIAKQQRVPLEHSPRLKHYILATVQICMLTFAGLGICNIFIYYIDSHVMYNSSAFESHSQKLYNRWVIIRLDIFYIDSRLVMMFWLVGINQHYLANLHSDWKNSLMSISSGTICSPQTPPQNYLAALQVRSMAQFV